MAVEKKLKRWVRERLLHRMSMQTYSRSFLQGLPEEEKQRRIDMIVDGFFQKLRNAAIAGETQYIYTYTHDFRNMSVPITLTNEDLIVGFQRKFPGCDVSYQETWDDINANTRILKKGIVIDWS